MWQVGDEEREGIALWKVVAYINGAGFFVTYVLTESVPLMVLLGTSMLVAILAGVFDELEDLKRKM